MKLHCPNCQKELVIEDQYAGQQIDCPMCQTSITVPSAGDPVPTPEAPPPEPAKQEAPAPEIPVPESSAAAGQEGYRRITLWFSPKFVQWVPAAALFIIGILTWFTWIWIGYGNAAMASQNGLQASFGMVSKDKDLAKSKGEGDPASAIEGDGPGVSVLALFYMMFLFLAFILAVGVAILPLIPVPMPPVVQSFLPWKWAVVTGVILFGFFLLTLQLMVGFSLENRVRSEADKAYAKMTENATEDNTKRHAELMRGFTTASIQRTAIVRITFFLHLLALICAGMMFVNDFRKDAPAPRIDFLW